MTRNIADRRWQITTFVGVIGTTVAFSLAAHIDFFDAGPFALAVGAGETDTATQKVPAGAGGAIGGERVVTLISTSAPPLGGGLTAQLDVDDPDKHDDSLFFTAEPGVTAGGILRLEYGSGEDLDVDFVRIPGASAEWDRVVVTYVTLGSFSGSMRVMVTSDDGTLATVTKPLEAGTGRLEFLHREFFCDEPTIDFTNIDRVTLEVTLPGELKSEQGVAIDFFGRGGFVAVPCAEDIDENGAVDFQDLLRLLSAWGECP